MNYVYQDNCVLRSETPPLNVELYLPKQKKWIPYPDKPGGPIRDSSVAAWFDGTPKTEQEAKILMEAGIQ